MNGKQLKNSILQWAIQGKLVPQDPNDEPASVLLEKIRAEKARLVKEGKLKKKDLEVKPIAEDEIPFEIPKGWEWVRISDLGDIITGGTPSKEHQEYYGDEYPFYKPGDLDKGVDIYESVDGLSQKGFNASRKLKANSILVTCIGATIGKTGLIIKEGSCNQQINAIIPYGGLCPKYIYYTICSPMLQMVIRKDAGQTTLPIMNKNAFCKLILPLPPLAEQHRIVAKIEELMPLVDKYGAAQDALDEWNQALPEKLKKSILQEAIQGKLVPQDPNDGNAIISNNHKTPKKTSCFDNYLFEIPDNWEWCQLFQIAEVIGGYAFQSADLKSNTGVRVIRISDITPQGLSNKSIVRSSLKDAPSQYAIKDNDILIAMTGGTVGKSLLLESMSEPMYLNQRVAIVRVSKDIDIKYLNLIIKSPLIQSIISDVKNSTNDNISMADITGFPIPLPPLAEQRRIVAKIEELFGMIGKK